MQTVPLGHTGVQVSQLCLGAMYFGTRQDEPTSFALLDQYAAAGGTFIDTANIYAHWASNGQGGESERMLGKWLAARGNRDQMFIATKAGFGYSDVQVGLSAAQISAECDKSLQRLGVDTIDLYYAHVDDRETPLHETLEAFQQLVNAGKVRFIGASNYLAYRLERARAVAKRHGFSRFCCVQQRHTYLRPRHGQKVVEPQEYVNDEVQDFVRTHKRNFTLLPYSVLLNGAYTRPDRPLPSAYAGADSEARLDVLRAVAAETGATPNQIVLAWLIQHDPPSLPLIAASTSAQMTENLGALDLTLRVEQMRRLNEAGA
ncbi:MAG: aldo/keto reductase [Anaerolineae bacterium]|nr:aldo/keto reductase [Anaerolineae bacterium]